MHRPAKTIRIHSKVACRVQAGRSACTQTFHSLHRSMALPDATASRGAAEDTGSTIMLPVMLVYTRRAMDRRMQGLERRIERIKRELPALGDLRPGSLSQQYNVCGVAGCRCKASPPKKHGPYYQLSISRKGKDTRSEE